MVTKPTEAIYILKNFRKIGLIPVYTSISWNICENIIYIYTDSGRLTRPVFYIENENISYNKPEIYKKIENNEYSFFELLIGFNKFKNNLDIPNDLNNFINLDNYTPQFFINFHSRAPPKI